MLENLRKIRHVQDLPKWFDLGKYKSAATLNLTGWYEQLTVRRSLHIWASGSLHVITTATTPGILDLIREDPIFDADDHGPEIGFFLEDMRLRELKNRRPKYSTGVFAATVEDLYRAEYKLYAPVAFHARKYFTECFWGDFAAAARDIGGRDWMQGPINDVSEPRNTTLIKIDRSLPDAVLIQQFARLLPSLRKADDQHLNAKQHRKPILDKWTTSGLLPYLDLMLWAKIENVRILDRVMADAIFLPGEGSEDAVRKTISKHAEKALSDSYLTELASLAALEIAEENAT